MRTYKNALTRSHLVGVWQKTASGLVRTWHQVSTATDGNAQVSDNPSDNGDACWLAA